MTSLGIAMQNKKFVLIGSSGSVDVGASLAARTKLHLVCVHGTPVAGLTRQEDLQPRVPRLPSDLRRGGRRAGDGDFERVSDQRARRVERVAFCCAMLALPTMWIGHALLRAWHVL